MSENASEIDSICDDIEHEYNMCSSLNGRLDHYYTNGSWLPDCGYLKKLVSDVFEWKKNYKQSSLENIIAYDAERVAERKNSVKNNDVWTYREQPPYDWNAKLPEWCEERLKTTIWYIEQQKQQDKQT